MLLSLFSSSGRGRPSVSSVAVSGGVWVGVLAHAHLAARPSLLSHSIQRSLSSFTTRNASASETS